MNCHAVNGLNSLAHQAIQHIFATASKESEDGGLAQLARALAWHARGHRFDSDILHPYRTTACHCGTPFFVSIHLACVGSKQAIDKARSHERIEQKNSTNRAHERGIPGWLGNEERGQEEKGDDQSNDSLGLVLIR